MAMYVHAIGKSFVTAQYSFFLCVATYGQEPQHGARMLCFTTFRMPFGCANALLSSISGALRVRECFVLKHFGCPSGARMPWFKALRVPVGCANALF